MIIPQLQIALAQAKLDHLRRASAARSPAWQRSQPGPSVAAAHEAVTLRFGVPADANRLARLAALDSSNSPTQPVLLAEIDGQLLAALSLSDGTAVADPFHPTADLLELLRARAGHLGDSSQTRQSVRLWSRLRASARLLKGDLRAQPHRIQ